MRACAAIAGLFAGIAAAQPPAPGVDELARLDLLPQLKRAVFTGSVSSYDRTGGNDDGFSGKFSFVRKEGDGLVLADLAGPGAIYRIWTPTPTDDPIEFYFDGEPAPRLRLKFSELFNGTRAPFTPPLAGFGGGGFYSYVPLAFAKSCKVVARAAKIQFYQINYATYAAGAEVRAFDPALPAAAYERARRVFAAPGADLTEFTTPPGATTHVVRRSVRLPAGAPVTVFAADRPGRIAGLRMGPASAFAGRDRGTVIRMFWDGDPRPAVEAPVSDLFGYSFGQPAMKGALAGTSAGVSYFYFPMPFDRSARIELEAQGTAPADPVVVEVVSSDRGRGPDEGRFYAAWRRENPTRDGVPFTFVDVKGRGHIAGVTLQAQGLEPGGTPFFEGDDQATLDGTLAAHGTGSEDFFNGGWYDVPGRWESRVSFPWSGCLDYQKHLGRTGAYRYFLTDAYAFRESAKLTIEHGPEGNRIPTDYVGVTYLYAVARPENLPLLPPLAARRVDDPRKVVFAAGWNIPVQAFSFRNATLAKKETKLGQERVRYLSMTASGDDVFGAHFLSLAADLPAAGRYRVSIEAVKGPAGATVQLFRNEQAIGPAADLRASELRKSGPIPVGELELAEGPNPLFFKLTGKDPQFDLIRIVCERLTP